MSYQKVVATQAETSYVVVEAHIHCLDSFQVAVVPLVVRWGDLQVAQVFEGIPSEVLLVVRPVL